MRVAIVSANIGGIDNIKDIPTQSVSYDYFMFTERNLPFPLKNLNNRLKGKYIKTKTHKFLKDYDIFIWIDGSIQITNANFVEDIVKNLESNDIAMTLHPERNTPFQEILYIQERIKANDEYLKERYENEPWDKEMDFYMTEALPVDAKLYACGVFARYNNEKVNKAFDDWWDGCIEFSNFDQSYFSYVAWRHDLLVNTDTKFSGGNHKVCDHVQIK